MKKVLSILMVGLVIMAAGTTNVYAKKAKKHKHGLLRKVSAKNAIHELQEAKEVLKKLPADDAGHISKATDLINEAEAELTEVN